MRALVHAFDSGGRAVATFLGAVVVILAVAAMSTSMTAHDVAAWAKQVFGLTFIGLMGGLVFTAFYCWTRLLQDPDDKVWLEAGIGASSGIATLALTYTLLGISLGVGSLASQELNPETVKEVVRELTEKFSLAFLTTVVGLPVSAVLRTALLVTHARTHRRNKRLPTISGED